MEEGKDEKRKEVGQPSAHPPPPTSNEEEEPIPHQSMEDQLHDLTMKFDSFWDEAQEYQVSMTQEIEELKIK